MQALYVLLHSYGISLTLEQRDQLWLGPFLLGFTRIIADMSSHKVISRCHDKHLSRESADLDLESCIA